MTLLIDTQVLVWLCDGTDRLGPVAKKLLQDPANRVLVSYFSFLEIVLKASVGKLTYDDSIFDDATLMGIDIVYPRREHLGAYQIYNKDNKDPFDNLLIGVANNEQAAFVTSDAKILASMVPETRLIDVWR